MSVCRFRRLTSCRTCLTSPIALSYKTLSGSAVFSALVDLLTFFFLWRNCASHRVALRRNNPVINNSVERFAIARNVDRFAVAKNVGRFAVAKNVDRFTVAKIKVLRKLHLAFASPGFLSAPAQSLGGSILPRTFQQAIIPLTRGQ